MSYKIQREQESDWTGTSLHSQARLPMRSAHFMNARKCVHAQKLYSLQAFETRSQEEENERKRDRKDKSQDSNGKKGSPTKQKPI